MKKESAETDAPMEKESMRIIEKYGKFITGKRIEKGLTLKQLSGMSGIPERNLTAIENERMKNFSLRDLIKCLQALEIPLGEVVYE